LEPALSLAMASEALVPVKVGELFRGQYLRAAKSINGSLTA
jgi:hypothetical protein